MLRLTKFALIAILFIGVIALTSIPTSADDVIGSVTVTVNKATFTGKCPTQFKFTGKIEVNKFPMVFNYHWERSDGGKTAVKVVKVPNAKTKTMTVVDTWQLGAKGKHFEGWVKLFVNSGNTHMVSEPASFTLDCK